MRGALSPMLPSKRRVLFITTILGLVAVPYGFLVYLQTKDNLDHLGLQKSSPPFIWPVNTPSSPASESTKYLTHQSFYDSVGVLFYASCHCKQTIAVMTQIAISINQTFPIREHFDQSDLKIKGIVMGSPSNNLAAQMQRSLGKWQAGEWYVVEASQATRADLARFIQLQDPPTPMLHEVLPEALIILWDNKGQIRAVIPPLYLEESNLKKLMALTSLVHFQSSLHEYLKGRTFFGEKKQRKQTVPRS